MGRRLSVHPGAAAATGSSGYHSASTINPIPLSLSNYNSSADPDAIGSNIQDSSL